MGLAIAGLAGCSSSGDKGDATEPITLESATGTWVLVSGTGPQGEVTPLEAEPIDLTFEEDGAFHGSSGCNSIMGTAEIVDGAVNMGAIGQTMMACDEEAMTVEFAYTQALDNVDAGKASATELTLIGDDVQLNFERAAD